ncbi:Bys1 family protein [Stagonosporopsis vannaccii]|nr:Bys1 family protein [Stagonosporopsis vannaccii]
MVTNQCDTPIYLWSVGGTISNQTILPKDSTYGQKFHSDPVSGGIALKITSTPNGLFTPNISQLVFAYNVDDNFVWYDLNSLFGDGFTGRTLRIDSSDEACPGIAWHDGRSPAGSQVQKCQRETNLELTFCSGHCLPSWSPCGNNARNESRSCCTHCIGSHHCVAPV